MFGYSRVHACCTGSTHITSAYGYRCGRPFPRRHRYRRLIALVAQVESNGRSVRHTRCVSHTAVGTPVETGESSNGRYTRSLTGRFTADRIQSGVQQRRQRIRVHTSVPGKLWLTSHTERNRGEPQRRQTDCRGRRFPRRSDVTTERLTAPKRCHQNAVRSGWQTRAPLSVALSRQPALLRSRRRPRVRHRCSTPR